MHIYCILPHFLAMRPVTHKRTAFTLVNNNEQENVMHVTSVSSLHYSHSVAINVHNKNIIPISNRRISIAHPLCGAQLAEKKMNNKQRQTRHTHKWHALM